MNCLYLSQDTIGAPSGGGIVTKNEYMALAEIAGHDTIIPVDALQVPVSADPFETDRRFCERVKALHAKTPFQLAHIYAGCFSETAKWLASHGVKVTYTAAAHDPDVSIAEFQKLGMDYPWRHMSDLTLRDKYLDGYRFAELVVCPSGYSQKIMHKFFCRNIAVIPHGHDVNLNSEIALPPQIFTVGFLGSAGPDKGVRYLLEAWKKLDWPDARLVIGGKNAESVLPLWRRFGGRVEMLDWIEDTAEFYRGLSAYVQPSATEGFGIEIIEALAHGVPVVASNGAGASEHIGESDRGTIVPPCDPDAIAKALTEIRTGTIRTDRRHCRESVWGLSWERIREKYKSMWRTS